MYLDILIIIIVILALVDGMRKGFLYQFYATFSIFLDYIIAKQFTPVVMDSLGIATSDTSYLLTFVGVFIVSYIVLGFVKLAMGVILKKQNDSVLSKLGGGCFGFLKGLLIAVIVLIGYNFLEQHFKSIAQFGNKSKINRIFLENSDGFDEYLPKDVKRKLTQLRGKKIVESYLNKVW